MSHTQKRRRASHTRCARRSLVELTAVASRAVDDGLFVLSSGIAASNPRSEHTGEKTSDQTILARQATAPSPVAVLESRNAAAPRKDEVLDSDTTTEMMVKIAKDYQHRAFENIKASLNAALDHAKDLVETRVGGEAASKDIGGSSLESNFLTVLREAASAFSMINQQLKSDGYAASIDPSIFIWLANITEPETRDTGTMRLEIVPNHRGRPSTYARQVAQFIWHLVEGQGCRRQAAYRGALTKFTISASFAETAYAFWEPIFKRAGPHVKMLTRI